MAGAAMANGCVVQSPDPDSDANETETVAVAECQPFVSEPRRVPKEAIPDDKETGEIETSVCEELCGLLDIPQQSVLVGCVLGDAERAESLGGRAGEPGEPGEPPWEAPPPLRGVGSLSCFWQVQCFPL